MTPRPPRRHPAWHVQQSRLAPLIHAAPARAALLDRVIIGVATLLLGMMLLRVLAAWAEGKLG